MRRSVFVLSAASAIAGCAGSSHSLPGARSLAHSRSAREFEDGIGGGDTPDPMVTPTPTPVPDSGLKDIGRTRARWDPDNYAMSNSYNGEFTLQLPFTKDQFIGGIKKCGLAVGTAVAAGAGFVERMVATFGARILAATGGVVLTELTVWEAIGVALSTIPAWEIVAAGIATLGTIADLYLLYICFGG